MLGQQYPSLTFQAMQKCCDGGQSASVQGQPIAVEMLNCVIAAFSRTGSLARAFETFEAVSELGLQPNTDSYNAIMEGLVNLGQPAALPKVRRAGQESPADGRCATASKHRVSA